MQMALVLDSNRKALMPCHPARAAVQGFKTGDLIKAVVPTGKKAGTHCGRVAVRATGSFNVKTDAGTVQGISWKHCSRLHCADGYNYNLGGGVSSPA